MTVYPPDQGRIIRPDESDFTRLPLPGVTAIDNIHFFDNLSVSGELISGLIPTLGTGILAKNTYRH